MHYYFRKSVALFVFPSQLAIFSNHAMIYSGTQSYVSKLANTLDACMSCETINLYKTAQLAFTCSKLTIETLEQGVKYVQS